MRNKITFTIQYVGGCYYIEYVNNENGHSSSTPQPLSLDEVKERILDIATRVDLNDPLI